MIKYKSLSNIIVLLIFVLAISLFNCNKAQTVTNWKKYIIPHRCQAMMNYLHSLILLTHKAEAYRRAMYFGPAGWMAKL